jgi:hydrogenase nickel incorporation protein HypB
MSQIDIQESIYKRNDELAAELNGELTGKGVFCVNVLGAPGVGKTTALIRLIPMLGGPAAVIEGDIESDIDTDKLKKLGIPAYQINTHGACHLETPVVREASEAIGLDGGFLFIENIGNLVCPAEFVIGEHVKLLITSVTEGSDKPYKYPLAFEKADAILINKVDLAPYVDFDEAYYLKGVRALNQNVQVFRVSGRTGEGFEEVATWLNHRAHTEA